jgi:exonuclease III
MTTRMPRFSSRSNRASSWKWMENSAPAPAASTLWNTRSASAPTLTGRRIGSRLCSRSMASRLNRIGRMKFHSKFLS